MYVSNRTESSEHLPPREHESAAGDNAAPLSLLFDSDAKGWRKRRNVFGGGTNQQNGTECFDGWGGSARQGRAVDTAEMGDERRRQKGISVAIVRRPDLTLARA
jgi:hypothetical protein